MKFPNSTETQDGDFLFLFNQGYVLENSIQKRLLAFDTLIEMEYSRWGLKQRELTL